LLREYLASSQTVPISIGVFAPAGAGKSFAISQVVEHAAKDRPIALLEFNMSQFTATSDLIAAFQLIRDKTLSGTLALAFFDEFDAFFGSNLGWLRYFLGPMQDGRFRDQGQIHPLGPAIFIFAGSSKPTFSKFSDSSRPEFIDAKGPDFVSRLRGYVDILGPDQVSDNDRMYPVRRAILIRAILARTQKQLMAGGRLRIDDGVLRALLTVPRYCHGARSIEAVLAMSALAKRRQFERSALPPDIQLNLHVDGRAFMELVRKPQGRER
jgi:hypothetical protein